MTMADAQVDSPAENNALLHHQQQNSYTILNSPYLLVNHHNRSHRGTKQKKRKRLNQVVDKLTSTQQVSSSENPNVINNNSVVYNYNNNNNNNNNYSKYQKYDHRSSPHYHRSRHSIKDHHNYDSEDFHKVLKSPKQMIGGHGNPHERASSAGAGSVSSDGGISISESSEPPITPKEMTPPTAGHMFRFDSTDRERILRHSNTFSVEEEVEDVFSYSSSSTKSPLSSNTDSPKINLSPLQIKAEPEETAPTSQSTVRSNSTLTAPPMPRVIPVGFGHHNFNCMCPHCCSFRLSGAAQIRSHLLPHFTPISISPSAHPMVPITSPSPLVTPHFENYFHPKYLPSLYRRRSHSDSDLPLWPPLESTNSPALPTESYPLAQLVPNSQRSSLESAPSAGGKSTPALRQRSLKQRHHSAQSSLPQECPLDLSTKSGPPPTPPPPTPLHRVPPPVMPPNPLEALFANLPSPLNLVSPQFLQPKSPYSVPVVKGDVASSTTKESVAVRYKLDVSPVVEEMPPGSDVAYVCPVCGQMFSLHDRLAKHMASRHKSRAQSGETGTKAYLCEVCKRSFARSDMLTRHMRLHTGIKPYTCKVCNQVFSRSDHLSTHQRTHTGEKPYKCPQCQYAACRRDMITRHMRTHTKQDASGSSLASSTTPTPSSSGDHLDEAACAAATNTTTVPGSPYSKEQSPTSMMLLSPMNTMVIKRETIDDN